MSLANLKGEYATVTSTQALLEQAASQGQALGSAAAG